MTVLQFRIVIGCCVVTVLGQLTQLALAVLR